MWWWGKWTQEKLKFLSKGQITWEKTPRAKKKRGPKKDGRLQRRQPATAPSVKAPALADEDKPLGSTRIPDSTPSADAEPWWERTSMTPLQSATAATQDDTTAATLNEYLAMMEEARTEEVAGSSARVITETTEEGGPGLPTKLKSRSDTEVMTVASEESYPVDSRGILLPGRAH